MRKFTHVDTSRRIDQGPLGQSEVVVLHFPDGEQWVDMFHNSAAGVRAQCLSDPMLGAEAFDYARDRLRERSLELLADRRMTSTLRSFTEMSLRHDSPKVWIHQGLWVRRARPEVQEVLVAKWQRAAPSCADEANLLRYGSKAPTFPPWIDILGGLFDEQSRVQEGKPREARPRQVNRFGCT